MMRHTTVLVAAVCTTIWFSDVHSAEAQPFPAVPGVHRLTTSSVYFAGQRVWRAERRGERVITRVLRSRKRGAIAFATRSRDGSLRLVVVLVARAVRGHVITWQIPRRAHRRGRASVMWMGKRKVGFGYSAVRPVVIASWRVRR